MSSALDTCSWEDFKKAAREFHDAAPTLTHAELENAWKCLGILYLGMNDPMWASSAATLLKMSSALYMKCCLALGAHGA